VKAAWELLGAFAATAKKKGRQKPPLRSPPDRVSLETLFNPPRVHALR
jgi:hypothetical protein